MLEAIKYKSRQLQILDQVLLPSKTIYKNINNVEDGWEAIKSMKVRGAPALSIVAALSLSVDIETHEYASKADLHEFVVDKSSYLETARPTAVNLAQVLKMITNLSKQYLQDDTVAVEDMKNRLITDMEKLLESDVNVNKDIGKLGGQHILSNCKKPFNVLTHCNTGSLATAGYGTALGVIRWLHADNHLHHAFCTETRPYNQGARLTAYELVHDNIPATLVCDSMAASLMKSARISAVVVGADRVVANGDTANKIGTYQLAINAKYHDVPFYVACPRSTLDFNLGDGAEIVIEERPPHEMLTINSVPIAAEGINCWNPAFDVTPASLITGGIITEIGVFRPSELKDNMKQLSNLSLIN